MATGNSSPVVFWVECKIMVLLVRNSEQFPATIRWAFDGFSFRFQTALGRLSPLIRPTNWQASTAPAQSPLGRCTDLKRPPNASGAETRQSGRSSRSGLSSHSGSRRPLPLRLAHGLRSSTRWPSSQEVVFLQPCKNCFTDLRMFCEHRMKVLTNGICLIAKIEPVLEPAGAD